MNANAINNKLPFANNLKMILFEYKISQKHCAEICGVRPSVISGWLNGQRPMDLLAINKFCESVGVSFEWLVIGRMSNRFPLFSNSKQLADGIYKITAVKIN